MKKFVYSALDDKKNPETKTTMELAKKALEEEHGSPFTQRIADTLPPKKFNPPQV